MPQTEHVPTVEGRRRWELHGEPKGFYRMIHQLQPTKPRSTRHKATQAALALLSGEAEGL